MYEIYTTFLLALIVSQAVLVAGILGAYRVEVGGPLLALWLLAFAVFVLVLELAATLEREESWRTPLLAAAMYCVYAPLWILVAVRALVLLTRQRGGVQWAKTPHPDF
jgi:hypothetical protein